MVDDEVSRAEAQRRREGLVIVFNPSASWRLGARMGLPGKEEKACGMGDVFTF